MDSPPYHYYHDPSTTNTHTSSTHSYPNAIDSDSLHYLIRHVDYATKQLLHSHRTCLHYISSLASEISTLNNNLTPSIHHKPLSNSTNLQTHNGYQVPIHQQPHPSLYNNQHSNVTTNTRSFNTHPATNHDHPPKFHLPTTYSHSTTTIPSPWISYTPFTKLQLISNSNVHKSNASQDLLHHTNHTPRHIEHELVDGTNFFPSTVSNSHVTTEEKKLINIGDVDVVTEPTHFHVVGESIFTASETDEKFEICDEVTEKNFTPTVVSQAVEEENKFAPDLIAIFNPVSDSVKKPKQHVNESFTAKPSTEKKVVRAIVVAETPQQHPLFILELSGFSIDIFDPGGMFTVAVYPAVCHRSQIKTSFTFFGHGSRLPNHLVSDKGNFFSGSVKVVPFSDGPASTLPWVPWPHKYSVFDPDGNEHRFRSPVIYINSYYTTPLLVPWDRGKIESCNILFSVNELFLATVLLPVRGKICGWPWVPGFRKHNVTKGGFEVFDPGGNEYRYCSPVAIDGYNRHTLSLLWLPWDTGKFTVGMGDSSYGLCLFGYP